MRALPPQLTEREWNDLLDLIAESPAQRLTHALKRVGVWCHIPTDHPQPLKIASQPRTVEGWLLYLASISSGAVFDRALLWELQRLSLH
jgi:hypothetical protein